MESGKSSYLDDIASMTKALKVLKAHKKRQDAGIKRAPYTSKLPARYRSYLNRANKKCIAFELSVEEFDHILGHNCVYCGSGNKIGIDRKDSRVGYTLDNCQPACATCNLMKYTWTEEVFLRHVLNIYKHRLT